MKEMKKFLEELSKLIANINESITMQKIILEELDNNIKTQRRIEDKIDTILRQTIKEEKVQ